MRIYVIRDLVAEESGPLVEAKNDAIARRMFKQVLEKNKGPLSEFRLLCVGEYDHDKDCLTAFNPQEVFNNQEENDE